MLLLSLIAVCDVSNDSSVIWCSVAPANRDWQLAVHYLDELLHIDNCHADAYFYRAQVCTKLKLWDRAVTDFSAAIHHNPMNAKAFYYRGCLLCK